MPVYLSVIIAVVALAAGLGVGIFVGKELRRKFAEKEIGVPITMVSNGPARSDIIYR